MATNYFGGKRKIYILWLIIIAIILIAVMFNIGSKGTQYIANRSANTPYEWQTGALQVRGPIVPDTCALTTQNCICNLSESMSTCTFNFNFNKIDNNVSIQVKQDIPMIPSITFTKSSGCLDDKASHIENCSVSFQWNKKEPGTGKVNIILDGPNGPQSLVKLQINAVN